MQRFLKFFFATLCFLAAVACKQEKKNIVSQKANNSTSRSLPIYYANGFRIDDFGSYKKIEVNAPWPDSKEVFKYILVPKGVTPPSEYKNATIIRTPVDKIVVTSTTDIPMLEYLEVEDKLIGFPNTNYISSEKTRKRIRKGLVRDLGKEVNINTEMLLELEPELVVGFSATGDIKSYEHIQKSGIPVVMNGSWMEQYPLGRVEWIKFFGAFFNKETEARKAFKKIENEYIKATALISKVGASPTILSGSMYKDVWYVPGGSSYLARIMKDAYTDYLWETDNNTGSLALSIESVLDKAQHAELWIGSGTASSLKNLLEINTNYGLFDAVKQKKVYTSSLKKGPSGGLIYYEIGSMRPDLILKDIIKIAHPELLPKYKLYFFEPLL